MAKKKDSSRYEEFFLTDKLSKSVKDRLSQFVDPRKFMPLALPEADGCPVCSFILRAQVDELIYHRVPPEIINAWLSDLGMSAFKPSEITKHAKTHTALSKSAKEMTMKSYMDRVNDDVSQKISAESLVDGVLAVFTDQFDPEVDKIKVKEALTAAKIKHDITQGRDDRRIFLDLYQGRMIPAVAEEIIDGEVEEEEG